MSGFGRRVDATQSSSYEGGFADGTRDGDGTFAWIVSGDATLKDEIEAANAGSLTCRWDDGEPIGPVEINLSSGVTVRGNLQGGVWDGEVVTTAADGNETIDIFGDGVWKDGIGNFVYALEAMTIVASMLEGW